MVIAGEALTALAMAVVMVWMSRMRTVACGVAWQGLRGLVGMTFRTSPLSCTGHRAASAKRRTTHCLGM